MRLCYGLLTAFALLLFTVSCKKSNPGQSSSGANSIQGNWNFLFLTANSTATASTAGFTEVSKTNYKTIDNAGTITFTADSMKANGLAYTVDTTSVTYTYVYGVLADSLVTPVSTSIPPTSEAGTYKVIGTDSITFSNGIVPTGYSSLGNGGRFVISNDTLKINVQGTESESGVNVSFIGSIYLKRQ